MATGGGELEGQANLTDAGPSMAGNSPREPVLPVRVDSPVSPVVSVIVGLRLAPRLTARGVRLYWQDLLKADRSP